MARVAATSSTVYVGNLAFVTTDAQILALFGRCGTVERVIMGLNKVTKLPCGFAFIMCVGVSLVSRGLCSGEVLTLR